MKWAIASLLLIAGLANAQVPVCMYQDNLSGPATGGEGSNGTYIDLFGLNFVGASVTVNGTAAAQVIYNGVDPTGDRSQVGIQVGSATTGTGAVVVTTGAGSCQYSTATISNVTVASGLATFSYTGAQLLAGQSLFVQGLTSASGAEIDGLYVSVLSSGLSSSVFTANVPSFVANQSSTADSGTASNGGFTVHSGAIYYIGPGTNNASASGVSCTTMKGANSFSVPWQVANNPTGTLNYDLQAFPITATAGTGYTTGSGTIGSCSVAGSGMVANFEANAGGLGNWQAVTSLGTGYTIGETCQVNQSGNTTGTVTIAGYPIESYTSAQFFTPKTYANCLSAGDTLVFLNGFISQYGDGSNNKTALNIPASGSSGAPITYMARPGATATLGGTGTVNTGIRNGSNSAFFNVYGLKAYGSQTSGEALNLNGPGSNDFVRVVGNTGICQDCWSSGAAISAGQNAGAEGPTSVFVGVLGNYVTDASCELPAGVTAPGSPAGNSNKQYHDFYLVGDDVEFGWNRVAASCAYNGMQINYGADDHTTGFTHFVAHDNDLSEVNGAGLNFATVDPNRGYVLAYNNILHHNGIQEASDSIGSPASHSCFSSPAEGFSASAAVAQVFDNTMFDCSSIQNSVSTSQGCYNFQSALQPNLGYNIVGNICYQPTYTLAGSNTVWTNNAGSVTITGDHDLFFYGAGTPTNANTSLPSFGTSGMLNVDPKFILAADGTWTNYNLSKTSPAIGSGNAALTAATDFTGRIRTNPPAIGALENHMLSISFSHIKLGKVVIQ